MVDIDTKLPILTLPIISNEEIKAVVQLSDFRGALKSAYNFDMEIFGILSQILLKVMNFFLSLKKEDFSLN